MKGPSAQYTGIIVDADDHGLAYRLATHRLDAHPTLVKKDLIGAGGLH